jgi:competence protein ComGC
MIDFLKEFIDFIKVRKKYWLLPILIILLIFGILIVLSQGTPIAPFIYTIF